MFEQFRLLFRNSAFSLPRLSLSPSLSLSLSLSLSSPLRAVSENVPFLYSQILSGLSGLSLVFIPNVYCNTHTKILQNKREEKQNDVVQFLVSEKKKNERRGER